MTTTRAKKAAAVKEIVEHQEEAQQEQGTVEQEEPTPLPNTPISALSIATLTPIPKDDPTVDPYTGFTTQSA